MFCLDNAWQYQQTLQQHSFQKELVQMLLKLLKFSATWCAPCKSLANNFKHVDLGDVELVSIDIEEDDAAAPVADDQATEPISTPTQTEKTATDVPVNAIGTAVPVALR